MSAEGDADDGAPLGTEEAEGEGLDGDRAALRAEVRELSLLTRVLVEILGEKGLLDVDDVRARLANARRKGGPSSGEGPYRAPASRAEPPPPGTIACARCGTFVAERKVFMNANGRFCRDCFEPG